MKLSGTALLMGRLRAESLNLVDAELAVRITPDGQVTVSAGDTAKPLATGVASKRDAGIAARHSRAAAPATGARASRRRPPSPNAERIARRPRLARQPEPDRARRPKPQRDRPEERQSRSSTISSAATNGISKISASAFAGRAAAGSRSSVGEEGAMPGRCGSWSGLQQNGVRSVDIRADKVPADQYPAGDAAEGSHLQRGPAAHRRIEGRTRPRRSADLFPRQDHRGRRAPSSTAIRPIIRWQSIRRK